MRFELSIRGIDPKLIKDTNTKAKKLEPEKQKAMEAALEDAKKRKAREYGRAINDKN